MAAEDGLEAVREPGWVNEPGEFGGSIRFILGMSISGSEREVSTNSVTKGNLRSAGGEGGAGAGAGAPRM